MTIVKTRKRFIKIDGMKFRIHGVRDGKLIVSPTSIPKKWPLGNKVEQECGLTPALSARNHMKLSSSMISRLKF